MIHPTAIISTTAKIASDVKVGAYAVIEDDVEIGTGSIIEPHAYLKSGAKIGENCKICSFATIAGDPQDLHFDTSLKTFVKVGNGTVVREGATIHRATVDGGTTIVGENCLLMANAHVAHDCVVGDRVIIAPFAALGGFAQIGCDAFISGGVMIHQKLRVGEGTMLSGNGSFSNEVPPYVNAYMRNCVVGLNLIGLRRRKVPSAAVAELKKAYMAVYATEGSAWRAKAMAELESGVYKTEEALKFLRFFEPTGKRYLHPRKSGDED